MQEYHQVIEVSRPFPAPIDPAADTVLRSRDLYRITLRSKRNLTPAQRAEAALAGFVAKTEEKLRDNAVISVRGLRHDEDVVQDLGIHKLA